MAATKEEILDAISNMKRHGSRRSRTDMEKKFGVTAAAPVALPLPRALLPLPPRRSKSRRSSPSR